MNRLLVPSSRRTMEKTIEQRYASKFCAKLQPTAVKSFRKPTELGSFIFLRWTKLFKNVRKEVEHCLRYGQPSINKSNENVSRVRDRQIRVWMITETFNISKTTVHDR